MHSEVVLLQQLPVRPHAALVHEVFALHGRRLLQLYRVVCVQPPPIPRLQQAPSAPHGFGAHESPEKNAFPAAHCDCTVPAVHPLVFWSQQAPVMTVVTHGSGEHEEYSAPCC